MLGYLLLWLLTLTILVFVISLRGELIHIPLPQ